MNHPDVQLTYNRQWVVDGKIFHEGKYPDAVAHAARQSYLKSKHGGLAVVIWRATRDGDARETVQTWEAVSVATVVNL